MLLPTDRRDVQCNTLSPVVLSCGPQKAPLHGACVCGCEHANSSSSGAFGEMVALTLHRLHRHGGALFLLAMAVACYWPAAGYNRGHCKAWSATASKRTVPTTWRGAESMTSHFRGLHMQSAHISDRFGTGRLQPIWSVWNRCGETKSPSALAASTTLPDPVRVPDNHNGLTPPYTMSTPQYIYVVLNSFFLTCLLVADFIGVKIFEIPLPFAIGGFKSIEHTCGMLTFPFTFLISDITTEYYGPSATKRMVYLGLFMSIFVFGVMNVAQALPYLNKPFNVTPAGT
jgi:Putative vitamin uptake transporter